MKDKSKIKSKYQKYKNKYRLLKGGLLNCPETRNFTFSDLLDNLTSCKIFTASSLYGINYVFGSDTPDTKFISSDFSNLGTKISNFLVKFSFINNGEGPIYNPPIFGGMKYTTREEDLIKEVRIQNDVYVNSCKAGYSICPPLVTAKIYSNHNANVMITDIITNLGPIIETDETRYIGGKKFNSLEILRLIQETLQKNLNYRLGVIVMELVDGYTTLDDYLVSPDNKGNANKKLSAISNTLYQNIRLISLGYKHGDLHSDNILYKEIVDDDDPLKDDTYGLMNQEFIDQEGILYPGRAMIIDFGRTNFYEVGEVRTEKLYFFSRAQIRSLIENYPKLHPAPKGGESYFYNSVVKGTYGVEFRNSNNINDIEKNIRRIQKVRALMLNRTLSDDFFRPSYDNRYIKKSYWDTPHLININTFKNEYLFRTLSIENNGGASRDINVFPHPSLNKIDIEIIMVIYNIVISPQYIGLDQEQIDTFCATFPRIRIYNLRLIDIKDILTEDSPRIFDILLNNPPTELFIEYLYKKCT